MCLTIDAEFRLCNPVVLQHTMFRRVLGEQRGYAAEISRQSAMYGLYYGCDCGLKQLWC
jgi:hypothetical protein